jgi:hypothetical protein
MQFHDYLQYLVVFKPENKKHEQHDYRDNQQDRHNPAFGLFIHSYITRGTILSNAAADISLTAPRDR